MAKHTPGRWTTDPEFDHQAVLGPDGFIVADCAVVSMRKGGPTSERCTANARLCAAAPDLLAALRYYVETDDIGARLGTAGYKAARAAIARATA